MSKKERYRFFWGGEFSNFHTSYFTDAEGATYSCTEQYYMAKKALFFEDQYHYEKIMNEKCPRTQKKYGRKVVNFDEKKWYGEFADENPAKKYMYEGNYLKYTQNKKLKNMLINTAINGDLVEASPYDKLWGMGMRADEFGATCKRFWRGKNWLGEILTKIRDEIIEEEEKNFLF